jgi:PAS domain S-box-containing protein
MSPESITHGENEVTIAALQAELSAQKAASDRAEARLRIALQVSRIGTWIQDVRTGLVEWSPELAELFGLRLDQAPRSTEEFFALVHPEDRERFAAATAAALRETRDYEADFRYLHSSGEYRWMNGRGRGIYDEQGELSELAGVGIDITEQQRARDLANDRASLLRQLGDHLPDGALYQVLAELDGGRRFLHWSAGIEQLIGVSAEEALSDPGSLYSLIDPQDLSRLGPAETKSLRELSRLMRRCASGTALRASGDGSISVPRRARSLMAASSGTASTSTSRSRSMPRRRSLNPSSASASRSKPVKSASSIGSCRKAA